MLDDAGGVVVRAADKAAVVGQQRQDVHRSCVVLEGAQDGAVVDVEELDSPVERAGERVLVVGQRQEALRSVCSSRKVFLRVPSRCQTRTVLSSEPLRNRWPSGIAATAATLSVCPSQVLTRLLVATLQTLTQFSSALLMMCWPPLLTAWPTRSRCAPLKERTRSVARVQLDHRRVIAHRKVHAVGQPRDHIAHPSTREGALGAPSSVHSSCPSAVARGGAEEALPPPQHRPAPTQSVCAWTVRSHTPSRHTLTLIICAGDNAAVGRHRHGHHFVGGGGRKRRQGGGRERPRLDRQARQHRRAARHVSATRPMSAASAGR